MRGVLVVDIAALSRCFDFDTLAFTRWCSRVSSAIVRMRELELKNERVRLWCGTRTDQHKTTRIRPRGRESTECGHTSEIERESESKSEM